MISLQVARSWCISQVALGLLMFLAPAVSALDDPKAKAEDDPKAKERLKWMQDAVNSLEPESSELKTKEALTFASKPLLRYSDPTRGAIQSAGSILLDGSVWRLGTEGRPTALVTIEIYQASGAPHLLSYEFLALTETRFSVKHKMERVPRWTPTESGLTLKELPRAPKPAASAAERLVQMRRLMKRFTAKERYRGADIDCRLLTQPIDRYRSEAQKIVDGAIFVYVNSTNPELGVVLESDGGHWLYGTLRLTASISSVALDGREVAAYEFANGSGSYQNGSHEFDVDK